MKKGFTLIELLAVIVILAIIALIAVPIILGVINNTKKESIQRSEELYLSAVKNAIAKKNLNDSNKEFNPDECEVKEDGNLICTENGEEVQLAVEVEGNRPCSGRITLDNGEITKKLVFFDSCPYIDRSGANVPDLMDSLTPVVYDEDGNWKVADPTSEWYNYNKQQWANAVILKENVDKKTGDTINVPNSEEEIESSDIQAMFVWIPRYSYTIKEEYGRKDDNEPTKALPGAIDIKFVGTKISDNGSARYIDEIGSSWYTHPAFTFGEDNLSGIWVGKFETTGTKDNPTILPNQESLRKQNVSTQFSIAQKFKKDASGSSHMMKNSEWGAVAYLSQSKYGKYGNSIYTGEVGLEKEVYINNCSEFITGIAGDTVSASESSDTCTKEENKYNGVQGIKASTTGNITGIYDMSGGAWDYVMGNYNGISSASGFSNDFFSDEKNSKYYNKYSTSDNADSCINDECKGHAFYETLGWYGDYAVFAHSSEPWFYRGGRNADGANAGVFFFGYGNGLGMGGGGVSFRAVISSLS